MKFAIPFVLSALFLASLAWILVNADPVELPPTIHKPKPVVDRTTALK